MCHEDCPFVDHAEYEAAVERYLRDAVGLTPRDTDPLLDYRTRLRADIERYERQHPEAVFGDG